MNETLRKRERESKKNLKWFLQKKIEKIKWQKNRNTRRLGKDSKIVRGEGEREREGEKEIV